MLASVGLLSLGILIGGAGMLLVVAYRLGKQAHAGLAASVSAGHVVHEMFIEDAASPDGITCVVGLCTRCTFRAEVFYVGDGNRFYAVNDLMGMAATKPHDGALHVLPAVGSS